MKELNRIVVVFALLIFGSIPASAQAAPVLLQPTNNAMTVGISPTLKAGLTVPDNSSLIIKFYGRVAQPAPGPDFTIVALPDTQYYTAGSRGGLPAMFYAQTDWILTNRISQNIAYMAQLGDCVDHGDTNAGPSNLTEWRNATNALYRLEKPLSLTLSNGFPYGVAVGNHDQSPNGSPTGTTTFYNQYFGVPHFTGRGYYGGHYGTNNDNHFDFFSASGMNFVAVYFEYDTSANPAVLSWANSVLQTNQNRRAIIVSHYIGGPTTPSNFGAQGAAIYNALKANTNLFLMLSGHVDGEGSRSDTYNGYTVHTLVSDYQFRTNGGNGFMRIMEFSPSNNVIRVSSYSPYTKQFETDFDSEFTLPYQMSSTNFPIIGTTAPVGTNASLVWSNLQANTAYEWYVTVSDGTSLATSPISRFTTAPSNSPPVADNTSFNVNRDSTTNLALPASDLNGDVLVFQLNSSPTHGVILAFDSVNGTFFYRPAHGYSGPDGFSFHVNDGQANSGAASVSLNVLMPADTNANGIPDSWEATYGISNANVDPDGDGQMNLQEYLANTNPTNAASALRILGATLNATGQRVISWTSVGGTRYRVQYDNGDANGGFNGIFTDIVRTVTAEMDGSPVGFTSKQSFTDDFTLTGGPPPHGTRYYRVKVVQ
jgi:Bacterial Ig domain